MSDIALQLNKQVIKAGDMSGNLDSGWIDISNVKGYCVQAAWTGTPAGNVIIQGSLDKVTTKDLSTTAAGGGAGNLFVNNDGVHYPFIKVIYTSSSSNGTLNAYVSGKK